MQQQLTDDSVALGKCGSCHLDTGGSKGSGTALWLSVGSVYLTYGALGRAWKPSMVLEVERDKFGPQPGSDVR